jgi:2-polyprenyl-6-methoxyphenol hydroxylase-like FAD-dependent oxidoreductase
MTDSSTSEGDTEVRCCIAGCGPAGAILGFLLARAGVDVLVLEKHGDFLRDFRGDTIHPSTLEILHDLGLADRFLQLPHTRVSSITVRLPDGEEVGLDLRRLGGRYPFVAFVPQWDFLDFITREAARYPGFQLRMNAEVLDLLQDGETIRGVRYRDAEGEHEIRALLTVGADGRTAVTRESARLPLVETSAPMDVLWFRLSRRPSDPEDVFARLGPGHFVVMFNRRDYWQVAYLIPKGEDARVRAAGLAPFRQSVAALLPELADRVDEIQDWDQVKLLTVRSDRLRQWYRPGYLAIGDAAHAMSPVGGVGINVAIQDAVTAANVLWAPLRRRRVGVQDLRRVQARRELPVRAIQRTQAFLQDRLLGPALASTGRFQLPPLARLLAGLPGVRDLPARLMMYGIVRPHVRSPEYVAPSTLQSEGNAA